MVIGNGMVAKRFDSHKRKDDFIVFASGVSNSKNTDDAACKREIFKEELIITPDNCREYFAKVAVLHTGRSRVTHSSCYKYYFWK